MRNKNFAINFYYLCTQKPKDSSPRVRKNAKVMMTQQKIEELISAMSAEEMRRRLTAYMTADAGLTARPVRIEVRPRQAADRRGRYVVVLVMDDGAEQEVEFNDRNSRLVYIYTLLHPQGFQRYTLAVNNYEGLCQLFSQLYFERGDRVLRSIGQDFNHFFSQAVAQSRLSLRHVPPPRTCSLPIRSATRGAPSSPLSHREDA